MCQSGFKFYQYSNPGRLLSPGVQLIHQTALTLLFFDQFAYLKKKILYVMLIAKLSSITGGRHYMAVGGGFSAILSIFQAFYRFYR